MRKIIISGLIAATALPGMAMAQSRAEVRQDTREVREQKRDLREAQRHGNSHDVRDARKDLREARQERREDWQDYRRTHRSVYARGNWKAPFRYQRWNTGVRLRPAYYNSRYYINDPHRYRLPAPGRDLRWVRHYNDVLLVNVRTGRVVQVHRSFFW